MTNRVLPHQWMRMQTGHGTKGIRAYGWAWLSVRADDTPDGHGDDGTSVLVARRHRYTGALSFFHCWRPDDVTLAQLVDVICRRWRIEETFQLGKTFTGMDEGQVTCWNSWMRFVLVLPDLLRRPRTHSRCHDHSRPCRTGPARSADLS